MSDFLRMLLMALGLILAFNSSQAPKTVSQHSDEAVAEGDFNQPPGNSIVEKLSRRSAEIKGEVDLSRSPVGGALKFDGYESEIIADPLPDLDQDAHLGISCWIQLEAYPWNRLPILDQLDKQNAFFFGLDAEGHLLARSGTGPEFVTSKDQVPLRKWALVTMSLDAGNVTFTIEGVQTPSETVFPEASTQSSKPPYNLLIGHVRVPLLPGQARLIHPRLPVEYSIEGSLGELTIYNRSLYPGEAKELFSRADPQLLKPLPWPKFPHWEGGPGQFGAFYTTLSYDPTWDAGRRIAPQSDVVVRFDNSPIELIFWQGANYVPAWVTENNRWYTDEFMEVGGHQRCPYGEDCEPMSDKQARYSHVRILESTPARVVVDWRYALSEVERYAIANSSSPTAWGDWADEYWTIYPDGVAIRKSVLWSTAADRDKTEFQESIVVVPPGQTPEDNLNLDALIFANLRGETRTYSWQQKTVPGFALPHGPREFTEPKDPVIQQVNLKSEWKPFEVAWGDNIHFDAYNRENSLSSFEWWNHWPVAQIPSSGRPALAADRAGHTSVSHIYWPIYRQDANTLTKILMTGLTTESAASLVPLARSWRTPATLQLQNGSNIPYDAQQRAYLLPEGMSSPIRMTLHANRQHPAVDPAFLVPGWTGAPSLRIVHGEHAEGSARIGQVNTLEGGYLVVYLPIKTTEDIQLELRKK